VPRPAAHRGASSKAGVDATEKIPGEGPVREWAKEARMSDEIRQLVDQRWGEYGL
jgi:4-hydroxy-3-polyprenylbenzoate decarboxylase